MNVTRWVLITGIVLAAVGSLTLTLAIGIGHGFESWEVTYVLPGPRTLGLTTIFITDVYRDATFSFRPPHRGMTTEPEPGVRLRSCTFQLSPDRLYMVAVCNDLDPPLTLMHIQSEVTYYLGAGRSPIWSPDGRFFAYIDEERAYTVPVLDGVPGARISVSGEDTTYVRLSDLTWSPEGDLLAFTGWTTDETSDIYTVQPDGSNLTNLTRTDATTEFRPTWSPDGMQLAYFSREARVGTVLLTMTRDGVIQSAPVEAPAGESVAWSPNGKYIAFTSRLFTDVPIYNSNDSREFLMLLRTDWRTPPLVMTEVSQTISTLEWAPDGNYIAFHGYGYPNSTIYILDLQTGSSHPLVRDYAVWLIR